MVGSVNKRQPEPDNTESIRYIRERLEQLSRPHIVAVSEGDDDDMSASSDY